ncbi:hypothetical protein EUGRSUZ_D02292 [Eucalyptus grandis]|uniref:Uncharacterized protein n=2 Tax=Eucalyptus grandis TaxID=71139 RepID=A0ACC3L9K3_EUCGR|nr:hypothetical protein EUGRSUZ_D02292 [Eucalyptus grandis]
MVVDFYGSKTLVNYHFPLPKYRNNIIQCLITKYTESTLFPMSCHHMNILYRDMIDINAVTGSLESFAAEAVLLT